MKRQKTNKWIINLLILFVVMVIVRFICALFTSSFPTVGIDEFLYYSLGRSIATEGKLLFRGQTANYAYILYPLTLTPIYLIFNEGANFYRLLQQWNLIMMSASVFPLFYLARAILKSEKKAFFFTVVSMFLPDFILGQLIFSEAILYPLFFTLIYCVYEYFQNGKDKYLLWSGLIGGLLYSTKPGAVTPAIVFFLIVIFNTIRKKERGKWASIIGAVIILAVTIAGFMLLARYGFGYQGGALSIYDEQIGSGIHGLNLGKFFRALIIYPYYFILACGIIGFVYPVFCYHGWSDELKTLWWFLIISIGGMLIGSAWAVERTTSLINFNIRYVAMYIPLMLLFCCVEGSAVRDTQPEKGKDLYWLPPVIIIVFVILCTLILGCKAGAQTIHFYALMSLSVLNDRVMTLSQQSIGNIIILIICAALVFLFIGGKKKLNYIKICISSMLVFMVINNVLCYTFIHKNYRPNYEKESLEVIRQTEGKPYIFLLSNEGIADCGVDVSTKHNNCVVFVNDFMNCLQRNGGVYAPYLPEISRGMAYVQETPDVDMLVVDVDSFPMMKFSQNASVYSPNGKGHINIVRFTRGEKLVDAMVGNVVNHVLVPEKPGILLLFREDWLNQPLTVRMDLESDAAQTMTIHSTHELYNVELAEGRAWYEIPFRNAEDAYNFIVHDKNIKLFSYELISSGGQ